MKISNAGINLIKHFEACKLNAYLCPAGVWTIGWGHTGRDVRKGMVITQAQADKLLAEDLAQFERDVNSLVKVKVTQGQFDALVSFAFNVGSDIDDDDIAEGLGDSTLLRKLNKGDYDGACAEFAKWNKSKGKVLNGLVRRRSIEAELFKTGRLKLA
jgi:lysozyme